jgi:hypothetical protein
MKILMIIKKIILFTFLFTYNASGFAQNWNKLYSTANNNVTDTIWRNGPIMISDYMANSQNNKVGMVAKYNSTDNRGLFITLNEPDWFNRDGDSLRVAKYSTANHISLVASNYANFDASIDITDVHNSTAEFSYTRGLSDLLGFRDGARMERAATMRLVGVLGNNERAYSNNQFDLLNLRFFTSQSDANYSKIDNFYEVRLEELIGNNYQIIDKGWGIYMQPKILNNYFGGKVGIGIELPTAALSIVSDTLNPLIVSGLKNDAACTDIKLLSVDNAGVVHAKSLQSLNENFLSITLEISLDDVTYLYVHKGPNATYTLPAASTRAGKTWKIVNIGSGIITFTENYLEGDSMRNTLLNKSGNYSLELFSDGTNYIALK